MSQKTKNLEETKKFAKTFVQKLVLNSKKRKHALVVALSGDLGSGKTSFTQGFAKTLGIKERVLSPTFIIERIYKINPPAGVKSFTKFIHIDAYRFKKDKEILQIGWDEVVKDSENLIVVEWAEKIKKFIPKDAVWLHFKYINQNTRYIIHAKKRK